MADGATIAKASIRAKLLALVAASVGLSVILISAVSASRDASRDAGAQAVSLQSSATVLAAMAADATAHQDRMHAFAALRAVGQMPGVQYGRVELADGRMLTETGAGATLVRDVRVRRGSSASLLGLLASRTITASAPVMFEGRPVGRVTLTGKLNSVAPLVMRSLQASALASLIALLVGLAIAWRMQRGITQPIVALTAFMRRIEESHDYGAPLDLKADGELGQLVGGFNRMLGEVSTRDRHIAEQVRTLDSQVRERTADLVVARDQADAANHAKSDFLATMSHEIRTPMNGIMVMAEMLAAGEMPPRQRRFAEVIAKSGSSLLAIINDILDFSKIEAGKMELEAVPCDVCEIVEDVASLFWERAASKGLDLAAYVDPRTPRVVLGDPVRLRQVITNLVNNAIKFTETGAVLIEVEPIDADHLRIAVRDTGVGIAQDKIGGVFGAFTQADQSTTRKFGGTGLGLAICKRLVDAMGGPFEVTSKVGQGSCFAFPLRAPTVEAAPTLATMPAAKTAMVAHGGVATRRVVARYLEAAGFELLAEGAGEVGVIVGGPLLLPQVAGSGRRICIAEYGETASQALVQAGKAEAVLVQPLRRNELLALLDQVARGVALEDPSRNLAAAAQQHLTQFRGRRILVADDSAVNREVALEALSRLGAEVVLVEDGRQAADAALAEPFDAILMDGSMPVLDGYDASREIRAREHEVRQTRTPIIALTAHLIGSAADAWEGAGMDAVLHKPFTLRAMADILARFIEPSEDQSQAPLVEPDPAPAAIAPPPPPGAAPRLFDPVVSGQLAAMAAQGRGDFVKKVFRLYREQAPAPAAAAEAAILAGDAEALAKSAHAIKSMSLNIGAEAVARLASTWENEAREGRLPIHADARGLQDLLARTLAALGGAPTSEPVPAPAPPAAPVDPLIADLRAALAADQLSLVYQPQFDRDGRFAGSAEALIRWMHPVRGFVRPDIFITAAEQAGMIHEVTDWVFRRAMRECVDAVGLSIAVNASATEFGAPGFVQRVEDLVDEVGFDPRRLQIEVTETAVIEAFDQVRDNILALKSFGVQVALDDFGSGYTSLQHLRRLPFAKLKLDRDFVQDCVNNVEAAAIVHAVSGVARALGMKIVAEGIEDEKQFKFLRLAGVHLMQGYHFAKPMPLAEVLALGAAETVRAAG